MKVTGTSWLVYGIFNGEPIAQFFDDGKDAWAFVEILRMYPHAAVKDMCLSVNEVRGVDYEAVEFIHHEEGVTKGSEYL
jgi:hypothetical protein